MYDLDPKGSASAHIADLLAGAEWRINFGPCAPACGEHQVPVRGASGSIALHDAFWALTNHTPDAALLVRNADRPTERFAISAAQGQVPIPFERADIGGTHGWVLRIAAKFQVAQDAEPQCDVDHVRVAWGLDPDSIAHSIMVMLTRHVVDGTDGPPPSTREIADQHLITPDTVRDHYARLIKLLGIEDIEAPRTGDGRRQALIDYARNHVYFGP